MNYASGLVSWFFNDNHSRHKFSHIYVISSRLFSNLWDLDEPAKRRFEPVLAGAGRLFRPLSAAIRNLMKRFKILHHQLIHKGRKEHVAVLLEIIRILNDEEQLRDDHERILKTVTDYQ